MISQVGRCLITCDIFVCNISAALQRHHVILCTSRWTTSARSQSDPNRNPAMPGLIRENCCDMLAGHPLDISTTTSSQHQRISVGTTRTHQRIVITTGARRHYSGISAASPLDPSRQHRNNTATSRRTPRWQHLVKTSACFAPMRKRHALYLSRHLR